jgi:CubicO group peptidase (beta-lactamase class C family)
MDLAGLEQAADLVRQRGRPAQLAVVRHGQVVLNRWFGVAPTSLFYLFSASKAFATVTMLQLIERGLVDFDAPVATYWPAYGGGGKLAVTIRQVMCHRSGMATGNGWTAPGRMLRDAVVMPSWRASLRRIERARLVWPPGEVPAYQWLAYGYVLGEVAQRVTGRTYEDLVSSELLHPLGMTNTYLRIGRDLRARFVPVRMDGRFGKLVARAINNPMTLRRVAPSAGITTTARDLARFYTMLAAGGTLNGRTYLSSTTLAAATQPTSLGYVDQLMGEATRWATGFQLGGPRGIPGTFSPMGRSSSPTTFGHNGSHACMGWADPSRGLAFAHLANQPGMRRADVAHQAEVADAVLAACQD